MYNILAQSFTSIDLLRTKFKLSIKIGKSKHYNIDILCEYLTIPLKTIICQ